VLLCELATWIPPVFLKLTTQAILPPLATTPSPAAVQEAFKRWAQLTPSLRNTILGLINDVPSFPSCFLFRLGLEPVHFSSQILHDLLLLFLLYRSFGQLSKAMSCEPHAKPSYN
jgi:hypothetical protein